jgi:hypothetical protein
MKCRAWIELDHVEAIKVGSASVIVEKNRDITRKIEVLHFTFHIYLMRTSRKVKTKDVNYTAHVKS